MQKVKSTRVSRRQSFKEKQRQQQRRQRLIILLSILGGVLVLAGIVIATSIINANQPVGAIILTPPVPRPSAKGLAMGDPNAPVKIEEYADFQCAGCLNFHKSVEQQITDQYVATGLVYFVYHTVGEWLGPESLTTAEAAYCAADQEKFWEYHDILFDNWNGENQGAFNDKRLIAFADKLGLNMAQFRPCFEQRQSADRVAQDRAAADKLGLQVTPSFVINGKVMTEMPTFVNFQKVIQLALTAAGK